MQSSIEKLICLSFCGLWLGTGSAIHAESTRPSLLDDARVDPMHSPAIGITLPQQLDNQSTQAAPIAVPLPRAWAMEAVGLLIVAGITAKKPRWIFN